MLKKKLRTFQEHGSHFLQTHPHALLADEPGLGKTVQAIHATQVLGFEKVVVVCPASVRTNWWSELHDCGVSGVGWKVISYEQAVRWGHQVIGGQPLDCIILDECHFLKTPESQRTQAIFGNEKGLARKARYKWGLSGSPVLNRPRELYPILKTLATDCIKPYDTFTTFAQRFCGAFFDGYGINTRGASHLDDLSQRLTPFMLRRTKQEVMPELPPKIITRVPLMVEESDMKALQVAEDEMQDREAKISTIAEDFSQLGDISHLLRLTGEAKVPSTILFIEELLETENKIVVFTQHRGVLLSLLTGLAKFAPVAYQGGMPDGQKQRALDLFISDPDCRIFIANISAGGTGINGLQEVAASVVFAELSWVPGEMSQAIDRLHRIGQVGVCINAYLLHIPGTLESAVLAVQNAKGSVIGRLMGENGWKS